MNRAFLRVPKLSNPGAWSTSQVKLDLPLVTILDSGWTVTFIRTTGGPATPVITPDLAPADSVLLSDKALSAYVVLPEAGEARQYWVPVSERLILLGYRFAQLQTADWTVIFLREAAP